jgi:ATP phosphoribosyltransferase
MGMFSLLSFPDSLEAPRVVSAPVTESEKLFDETDFRFAVQKSGELTEISLKILADALHTDLSHLLLDSGRRLHATVDEVGVVLVRNKSICQLVAQGSVDLGVVGIDQVYESGLLNKLIIVKEFRESAEWDMVLATLVERTFTSLAEIRVVATQYPLIAQAFFHSIGYNPQIIKTEGSTEVMPRLTYNNATIDGIVDMCVTGTTLAANGLQAWQPAITKIYPVLVANPDSFKSDKKNNLFQKFI